jgi:hypothetical protein
MSKPTKQRRYISSDALLALERLVVGRECNEFDILSTERKVLAYMILMRLGLVKGTIVEVPGRGFPDVIVEAVTEAGRKAYMNRKFEENQSRASAKTLMIALLVLFFIGIFIYRLK